MKKGLSNRAFAKLDGCTEGVIRTKKAEGLLVPFDDGSLNPADVGGDWRKRTFNKTPEAKTIEPTREEKIVAAKAKQIVDRHGVAIPPRLESETKRAFYLAIQEELNSDRKEGLAVPIAKVIEQVGASFSRVRSKLSAMPALCASELALMTDANEIRAFLKNQIETILKELSFDVKEALDTED